MQPNTFRFDNSRAPEMVALFETATLRLDSLLKEVDATGAIRTPWLGDEVSRNAAAHFNKVAVGKTQSGRSALLDYRAQLEAVTNELRATATAYEQGDQNAAASLRAQYLSRPSASGRTPAMPPRASVEGPHTPASTARPDIRT